MKYRNQLTAVSIHLTLKALHELNSAQSPNNLEDVQKHIEDAKTQLHALLDEHCAEETTTSIPTSERTVQRR